MTASTNNSAEDVAREFCAKWGLPGPYSRRELAALLESYAQQRERLARVEGRHDALGAMVESFQSLIDSLTQQITFGHTGEFTRAMLRDDLIKKRDQIVSIREQLAALRGDAAKGASHD